MKSFSLKYILCFVLSFGIAGFSACVSSNPKSSVRAREVASQSVGSENHLERPAACPTEHFSQRVGYSICFTNSHKQAMWVAYELTREHLNNPVTGRTDEFMADSEFDSARPNDYSYSGYERGHLAPSADMKWSTEAQLESFSMANMTPQSHAMNHGRWKDLEDQIRNFARSYGSVFIVMGPLLNEKLDKIEGTSISIPKSHFKCVLETADNSPKSICFIVPQEPDQSLTEYVVSVDKVEALTGLDLFAGLDDAVEAKIESVANLNDWTRGMSLKPFLNRSVPQKNSYNHMNRRNSPRAEKMPVSSSNESGSENASGKFTCAKKTCKQIRSCEEAKYLLKNCGLTNLDGNGDGIPCESSLCK